jgi:hypothetical protein
MVLPTNICTHMHTFWGHVSHGACKTCHLIPPCLHLSLHVWFMYTYVHESAPQNEDEVRLIPFTILRGQNSSCILMHLCGGQSPGHSYCLCSSKRIFVAWSLSHCVCFSDKRKVKDGARTQVPSALRLAMCAQAKDGSERERERERERASP